MKGFAQVARLLQVNMTLMRHGLDEIILATHLFRPVRFIRYLLPWRWFHHATSPRAVRLRQALEDLGPLYVKFGQALSTRRDLLPPDIADEFAKLQDCVPPFDGLHAAALIEQAYGHPLRNVFAHFDAQPLASASIAQVHVARLHDGQEVVVKVVRPTIEKIIRRDLALLHTVADWAERYWKEGRRWRPREVVAEYEKTILDELDLLREAANASQLRRNFLDSPLLYVPEVYWPYTRRNVMVMERIMGTPIGDIAQLKAQNIDLKVLAERGVEIFFTQVFHHNFFHADMHPGNIFVSPEGKYIAVDFGIMGSLSPDDQRYLAENFIAFFNRDYHRVAALHIASEWVPRGTRVDEFESAIRSVCEPIFERPLKDISLGNLLLRLFQTARRFHMEVQPQLVLLQKTLLSIEGLGRQLYPDLDLWTTAKPFLERWMRDQLGIHAAAHTLRREAPRWLENLPRLPGLAMDVLFQAQSGRLKVEWRSPELTLLRSELRHSQRRMVSAMTGAALLVCASVLFAVLLTRPPVHTGWIILLWTVWLIGLAMLYRAWRGGE